MTKYQIEVEIPDGEYCACYSKPEENLSCQFLGDSTTSSAGLCHLLPENPLLQYKGGSDKREMSYHDIVKHPDCPSRTLLPKKATND